MIRNLATLLLFMMSFWANGQYSVDFEQRALFIMDVVYDYGWVENDQEYRPSGFGGCSGSGSLSDYGKYVYPWMIAHFEKDGDQALTGSETQKVRNTFDSEMHTCPTFHFNLVGLPRLIYQYPYEPNFQKNIHGGKLQDYLNMVFNRTDSYNAFTGEGTENHLGMSRLPGYLYAQLAIDSGYTDVFPAAPALLDSMKHWIMETSRTIYQAGVAEWNSSTYGAYNILGWLLVYDFANDQQVRNAARAVLDYYAAELALHYQQGMTSGAEMRGGSSVKSLNTETDILAWLWFGDAPKDMMKGNFPSWKTLQTIHAATSTYRPPYITVQLARKELRIPAFYHNSKSGYLYEQPSMVKQTYYVNDSYSMGVAYTPYGGWGGGDWQIVSWKMVARVNPETGDDAQYASGGLEWGGYRRTQLFKKPWEQFAHHKNVMVLMTKRPENHSSIKTTVQSVFQTWRNNWGNDFYQRFPGDTDKQNPVNFQEGQASENQTVLSVSGHGAVGSLVSQDVRFILLENVYLAVRYLYQEQPASFNNHGDFFLTKDHAPDGHLTGLIVEVAEKSAYNNFTSFRNTYLAHTSLIKDIDNDRFTYISLYGDTLDVQYEDTGSFSEPVYDWGYGPVIPMVVHRSPPFIQPQWPEGKGFGTQASFSVNNDPVNLDEPWDIYSGPDFRLHNGILKVRDTVGNIYRVDFSGPEPVFDSFFDPENDFFQAYDHTDNPDNDPTFLSLPGQGSSFSVYPNPVKDVITIKSAIVWNTNRVYRILDVYGRMVLKGMLVEDRLNLAALPKGNYVLEIIAGNEVYYRTVITVSR